MKRIITAIIPVLFLVACTKDLSSVNVDPKKPTSVSSSSLFTMAQHGLVDILTSANVNRNVFRLIEQQWQETTYLDESQYDFVTRNIADNLWNAFYREALNNFEASRKIMSSDVADENQLKNQIAILDIMEVYTWYYLLTTYGNIPFKEALNIDNTFPKYDDALSTYKELLRRLDLDITALNPAAASFGNADAFYAGDPAKWKRFANSLKLKMAITIADADPAIAKAAAESAVASGVFNSNDDSAKFPYISATPNTNPVWIDLIQSGRQDFVAASTIIKIMTDVKDPRLAYYFTKDSKGGYSGGAPGVNSPFSNFSHTAVKTTNSNFPGNILDYAEVQFLMAEAAERTFSVGNTAEFYYKNAITTSILDWGGSTTEANAYLLQPEVAYATAGTLWKQKIGIQKWISLYNRGIDAWISHRQLDFPVLELPADAISGFPTRFTYPVNEQNVNNVNRSAAAAAIGGDVVETKLFFDKF